MVTEDEVIYAFYPEFVSRLPTTIYAVKYRGECQDGKTRTYIFLLGSKAAYDARIAGPEKGQGLVGTVTWETVTPPVKSSKGPKLTPGQDSLF